MADLLNTNALAAALSENPLGTGPISDALKGPDGGTPFWIALAIAIALLLAIIYFVFLKTRGSREPVPRVPHPPHAIRATEPAAKPKTGFSVQQTVNALAQKQAAAIPDAPYEPSASNPALAADEPKPRLQIAQTPKTTPRRLRRFERQDQNKTGMPASPIRRGRTQKTVPDIDVLAEDIASDVARSDAVAREMQELQKRLAKNEPIAPAEFSGPETAAKEPASERRHHGRRFQKQMDAKKEEPQGPPAPSTASLDTLSQVQGMEFKDLFGEEKKTKKKKSDDGIDGDLAELGGEDETANDETGDTETCPSCKKQTEKIVYCPECGNAFCENCSAALKRKGNDSYLVCPKCQTEVKNG